MSITMQLTNVSVANSVDASLDVTNDDIAIANTPSIAFWLQAGAKYRNAQKFKDRIGGRTITPTGTGTGEWTNGTFDNGASAIVLDNAGAYPYLLDDKNFEINKTAWTALFVFERNPSDMGNAMLMGSPNNADAAGCQLYIGMTTAGVKLYSGASSQRIFDPIATKYVGKTLIVITFSVDNGLTIRRNGVVVATNANDKNALTDGKFRLGAATGITTPSSNNALGGKLGCVMMFNDDLSKASNLLQLQSLETILLSRYNITKGA